MAANNAALRFLYPRAASAPSLHLGDAAGSTLARPALPLATQDLLAVTVPAYLIDTADYGIRALNDAARTERSLPHGATCYAYLHGRERPCPSQKDGCPIEQAVRTNKPVQVLHPHHTRSGEPRLQHVLVLPVLDRVGERPHVLHYHWDVSADEARAWVESKRGGVTQEPSAGAGAAPDLTAREHDVLVLVVKGLTNASIAQQLQVSVRTVKGHVGKLFKKLGATGRAELVGQAVHQGLVFPD